MVLAALILCALPSSATAQTRQDMWSHYRAAADVQAAVVAGDLDASRKAAAWLARHEEEGLPGEADAFAEELRRAAARAAEATTLVAAASATGRIAAACGSCHRERRPGMQPTEHVEPPPDREDDVALHMVRHDWAVDRLWEGLVLPSDDAWEAGWSVFSAAPLDTDKLTFDNPEGARVLANRVHELGRRAGLQTEPSLRARAYGDLLATCAACHQLTGQEPAIRKLDW
jgi:mono/diheme cytochrome c family protein